MKAIGEVAKQAFKLATSRKGLRGSVGFAAATLPCGFEPALLLVEGGAPEIEILLQDADFPKEYIDMAHPEDYVISANPIEPSFIDFQGRRFGHNRLIMRVSFELENSLYVPMSFVVDTGAPFHFYMSDKGFDVLKDGGRILKDGNTQDYLKVFSKNALVHDTPTTHKPANIMGLMMIKFLHGVSVGGDSVPDGQFRFGKSFSHF